MSNGVSAPAITDWSIATQIASTPTGIAYIALLVFGLVALAFAFGGRS